MPILSPMSSLEAVNDMLLSIGQAPVNTLEVTGIKDVSIAKARLDQATRRTLSRGFSFNTDIDYPLTPDVDGVILVPSNALKVESMGYEELVQRRHPTKGMALYNKDERTFVFTEAVDVKIVWAYPFEDLPETARAYIATSAARRFQSKVIGSAVLDAFEEEDEMRAWMLMEREERGSRKTNLFRANPSMAGFSDRSH